MAGKKPSNISQIVFGVCACLIPLILSFLPDEQLVRLKLEALEILVFVWLTLLGINRAVRESPSLRFFWPPTLTSSVLLWIGVSVAFWFLAPEKSLASMELRRVCLAGALFLCVAGTSWSELSRTSFFMTWLASSSLIAFYGILQRTGGVGSFDVPKMDRVIGTFGNPIFFAVFLVVSLFLGMAAFVSTKSDVVKIFISLGLLLQGSALYLTQTRAAWLALAGAVCGGILYRYRGKKALALIILLLAGLAVGFLSTKKIWLRDQAHLLIWRDTARMWIAHPLKGVGLGAFHTNFPQYARPDLKAKWPEGKFIVNYAHNEYLQTLAEGGAILLMAFLFVLAQFFRTAHRVLSPRDRDRTPYLFVGLAVLALLIQNLFSVDMRFSISFSILFLLMGLMEREGMMIGAGTSSSSAPGAKAAKPPRSDLHGTASSSLNQEGMIVRFAAAGAWTSFMGLLVFPALIHPYLAEKAVKGQKDFFDVRLLDPAKTISDLEELAKNYPREYSVWERLGYATAKEIKSSDGKINEMRADQAIEAYQRVVQLKPDYANAFNNLGNIYFTIGQGDKALETWAKAVQIKPDFVPVHLNLGKVLYTRGRLKESAEHFEQVLRYDPGNAEAVVYLKKMVE